MYIGSPLPRKVVAPFVSLTTSTMALHGQPAFTNGRPLQPPPFPGPLKMDSNIHSLKEEYSKVLTERDSLRLQFEQVQATAKAQEHELHILKQSLRELQQHHDYSQQRYDEERRKLHEELRQQRGCTGLPPPSPLSDHPSNRPSPQPPLSTAFLSPTSHLAAVQPNGNSIPTDDTQRDRKMKGRAREDDAADRRDAKRARPYDNRSQPDTPPVASSSRAPPPLIHSPITQQPLHQPHSNRSEPGPSTINGSQRTRTSTSEYKQLEMEDDIPENTAAPPMPDEFTLLNAPPGYRKVGQDWSVTFNPRLPKSMDVNLMMSIPHQSVVCSIHFSPDGRYVATGCNRAAYIWDIRTGAQICSFVNVLPSTKNGDVKPGDYYVRSVRFSPNGEYLATGSEDKKVRVWYIREGRLKYVYSGHDEEIYALDYAKNGQWIVSGSADQTARVWNLGEDNHKVFKVESSVNQAGVACVSASPNSRYIAGGCFDRIVRVWDYESGHLIAKLEGHKNSVYSVKFMPDGRGLVSASLDYLVKQWDLSQLVVGEVPEVPFQCTSVGDLRGHGDFVLVVACSEDNRFIASGSKDRSIMFWDSNKRIVRFRLDGHKNSVISVDIQGSLIATASGDQTCRIWSYTI